MNKEKHQLEKAYKEGLMNESEFNHLIEGIDIINNL